MEKKIFVTLQLVLEKIGGILKIWTDMLCELTKLAIQLNIERSFSSIATNIFCHINEAQTVKIKA